MPAPPAYAVIRVPQRPKDETWHARWQEETVSTNHPTYAAARQAIATLARPGDGYVWLIKEATR